MKDDEEVYFMKEHTFLGRSSGKRFCIDGVDVFANKWQSLGRCEIVLDPSDKRPYNFSVYKVDTGGKTVTFAAGRFRDDQWGFYLLADE